MMKPSPPETKSDRPKRPISARRKAILRMKKYWKPENRLLRLQKTCHHTRLVRLPSGGYCLDCALGGIASE